MDGWDHLTHTPDAIKDETEAPRLHGQWGSMPSSTLPPPQVSLSRLTSPSPRVLPQELDTHPPAILLSQAHISFGVIIKITYSPAVFFP